MEYEINSCGYDIVFDSATIDTTIGEETTIEVEQAINYIKSGEQEIKNYVENVSKPEINDYINTYANPIVAGVIVNIAKPTVEEYIEGEVKPEISSFAAEEMHSYAETATAQAGIASVAAADAAVTAQSVDNKVVEFVEQTETSKQEFISFVGEKTEEFQQITQQATADSLANVEKSRIWAEGEQEEVQNIGGNLSSMGSADLAYALANADEDVPIETSNMFAMNIFRGEKGDKGDKGEPGKDGKDGGEFDYLNFLNILFPVGSLFLSTNSTCSIQDLGVGTWEIVGTSLVSGSEAAVAGNGMTLGLTDGTHNGGLQQTGGNNNFLISNTNTYNKTIPTGTISNSWGMNAQNGLGVTTDPTKSGIIANLPTITANIFRRIS